MFSTHYSIQRQGGFPDLFVSFYLLQEIQIALLKKGGIIPILCIEYLGILS